MKREMLPMHRIDIAEAPALGSMRRSNASASAASVSAAVHNHQRSATDYVRMVTPTRVDHEQDYPDSRDDDEFVLQCGHTQCGYEDEQKPAPPPPSANGRSPPLASDSRVSMTSRLVSEGQRWYARLNPNQELKLLTNHFRDPRMEESYQVFTSMVDFLIARRILLFMLVFEVMAFLLFLYLKTACVTSVSDVVQDSISGYTSVMLAESSSSSSTSSSPSSSSSAGGASCSTYSVHSHLERSQVALMWAFAPLALLYGGFPLQWIEGSMRLRIGIYYIRRRWKAITTFIVLLWAVGLELFVYHVLLIVRDHMRTYIPQQLTCATTVDVPFIWYEHSQWTSRHDMALTLSTWVLIYGRTLAYSVIMGMMAVLATFAGIFSVSLKLDFTHVLFVSMSLWLLTLGFLIFGPSMSLNSTTSVNASKQSFLFLLCVLLPTVFTLMATYSTDRAARMAYAMKLRAERMNTTLKLDLSVKRIGLENQSVAPDEEEAMKDALARAGDMKKVQDVSIPFDDLELKEIISTNAHGEVLLADYYGTLVVLKRLVRSALTPEGLTDFKLRVDMLASLRHPNVVQFIGATFDNLSNVGFVLEYMERGDLFSLIRSPIPLTWSDPLLKIATDVAQGVSYLHNCEKPIVHRDLKSSNLLCTPTYSCKITDFCQSKRQSVAGAGLFSTMVGTAYWVAPEILRQERYDVQVDCYSFGVILIELETRKDPYYNVSTRGTMDLMRRVAAGELRPMIPESCSLRRRDLINRCLDSNPKRRPRMTAILHTLQHEVRQELVDLTMAENARDTRRMMLLQRHQQLNRRGVRDLLLVDDENGDGDSSE